MIWRDDDIGVETTGWRLERLRQVDDLFQTHRLPHTVAVLAVDLELNPDLIALIRNRKMIVQLHGWEHEDYVANPSALLDLPVAVSTLERLFKTRPTVFYPPWNRSNDLVAHACDLLGLTVSAEKISLEQYIRVQGDADCDTVNFHYWNEADHQLLREALEIHRRVGVR